jgi:sec-independent protein translocase protein TatB
MFGVGFSEVLVIAVILIIVVGPTRLPGLMAALGRTLRSARQASEELRSSLGLRELLGQDPLQPRRRPPPSSPPDRSKPRTEVEVPEEADGASEPGGSANAEADKGAGRSADGRGASADAHESVRGSAGGREATGGETAGETRDETAAPEQDRQGKDSE